MLRLLVPLGIGVMVGRAMRSDRSARRPEAAEQPKVTPEFKMVPAAGAGSASDKARALASIAEAAIDPVLLAYQKVSAGLRDRPDDEALNASAEELELRMAGLRQAFWNLHGKELAQAAIDDLAAATSELQTEAARMPEKTKTAAAVKPVIDAAVKVGTKAKAAAG